jgi:chaperonin GroES
VGPGKSLDNGEIRKLTVKAGDKVLVGKYAGTELKLDGIDYVVLREDEILGIIG